MTDIKKEELFAPFKTWGDRYYGLCVQDGQVTTNPVDGRYWTEYHLEYQNPDVWELEVCEHENTGTIVYRGKIPNREFFLSLMANIEGAPPLPST